MDRNGLKKKYSGTNIRKFFMAREILKIKTYVDGKNDLPFPSAEEQIGITEYTYTSKRMGNVTLSARLMHRRCLDKLWTGLQYVEFRGEKYFISATPSSGKDNEDARYEHTLSFIPERDLKLNNVYFYDAVSEESTGDDKYKSNSTNVVFFGTIEEFVARLNESLKYSGLDYTVVIDEGITSEAKLMSFEDQFFFSVLQEIYNTYELPFYFVGKVIHIGFTSNAITQTFKYGFDNELLSIKKNNANYRIINRCTGTGSEDNIPYYYPNSSPKGDITAEAGAANAGIQQEDISIVDYEKFASGMDINSTLEYIAMSISDMTYATSPLSVSKPSDIKELQPIIGLHPGETDHVQIYITANIIHPGIITLPLALHIDNITEMPVRQEFDSKWDIFSKDDYYDFYDDSGVLFSVGGTDFVQDQFKNIELGDTLYIKTTKAGTMRIVLQINTVIAYKKRAPGEAAQAESKAGRSNSQSYYTGRIIFEQGIVTPSNGVWSYGNDENGNIVELSLEDVGLSVSGTPADGDTITQKLKRYITPSKYLMPPVYRESLGAERFYNALNDTYTNPDTGEKYVFENVYDPAIPREHKQEFGDIKPTIKGMTNAAGQRMDQILDIAFDLDDNDEVDAEGKYLHPYFFVKLPKYDGDYGFNLFDHAIDEEEMSISMTSGQCGACEFIIGVSDDEAQRNLVQVDSSGNLLRDSDGNVRCGREGMPEESPQDRQNDTMNYEVWIALKKEESTYGQIMPNAQQNLKPAQGDTFVILHIDLPQAYILNAENELKEAIIKYMAQNNSEKFNFSITFSRIYLEEHPDIETQLNENARIQVEYDGVKYEFYISQYTYKCLDEEALPEISVEITDTVTVNRTTLQNTADAIIKDMNDAVGNIDFLAQGLRYFIRKDVDDVALGTVTFRKGVLFGNFSSGLLGSGAAIRIDGNGSSHAEFDFLTVRRKAVFKELSIEEVTHAGGQIIVSPASMVCSEVEDVGDAYRCYFESEDADGASVYNQFAPGDQVRCQTFNMWGNRYYWRLVVETGRNYIDLSKTDADTGSDIPQAGDRIVQLGNRNDTTRQAAQIISCFGENSPSYVMYNGINSYSLADKNITGIIYNQETAEPQMYSYGSFYFGDRDIDDPDSTFITFQQKEGETRKRLFISADVKIGPGSSGLSNLEEWGDLDQSIKDLAEAAEDAQKAAEDAQKAADDAQKEIDGWLADGVISPLEKQGLKNEAARIKADYEDVQSGYSKYGLGNPTDYNLAYVEYYNVLSEILSSPEQNVPVPSNFDTIQDTYYDRWVDALEAIAAAAKNAVSQAQEDANTAQDTADEALQKANEAKDYIDNTLPDEIANINKKLDGVVETWFYPYSPTLSNEPAATWIKNGEQEKHIGDMFLNNQEYVDDETTPDAGKAWRWEKNTSGDYFWNQVADSDAVKALQDAAKAQDTADQKRRVFVTTPYTPYDVGDMWTQGASGDIMRCIKARATGSYTASDWDRASKYTDDALAQEAIDLAKTAIVKTDVMYYLSTSPTSLTGGSWSTTAPAWEQGKYLWSKTVQTYASGGQSETEAVCITGNDGKGIVSVTEYYYVSTSPTTLTGGSWSTTAPQWESGSYIWTKSRIAYSDGTTSESSPVCTTGAPGKDGSGAYLLDLSNESAAVACDSSGNVTGQLPTSKATVYYGPTVDSGWTFKGTFNGCAGSVNSSTGGITVTGISADSSNIVVTATKSGVATLSAIFSMTKVRAGRDGTDGDAGKGVTGAQITYQAGSSGTSIPTGSWSPSVPSVGEGQYLWTKVVFSYTDGTHSTAYSVSRSGEDGATGNGVQSVTEYYLASASGSGVTTGTPGWTTTVQTISASKKYLWNYEKTTYTDGSSRSTTPVIIGTYGRDGIDGTDGVSITEVKNYYLSTANSAGVTTDVSGWTEDIQTITEQKRYLWNYEKIIYSDGGSQTTQPCIIGVYGDRGNDGKGIKSTEVRYQVGTSGTSQPTGTWSATVPSVPSGQFLWTRTVITYTDDNVSTFYSVSKAGENGQAAVIYYLLPSADKITKGFTGTIDPETVTCAKYKQVGNQTAVIDTTSSIVIKYQRLGEDESEVNYSGAVQITENTTALVFTLYSGSTVIDRERVPVLADASDLEIGSGNLIKGSSFEGTDGTVSLDCSAVPALAADSMDNNGGNSLSVQTFSPMDKTSPTHTIPSVSIYYGRGTLTQPVPTSWSITRPALTSTYIYLYAQLRITYSDNTQGRTFPVLVGQYYSGNAINSVKPYYLVSSAEKASSDSGEWSTTRPALTSLNRYMHVHFLTTYSGGTSVKSEAVNAGSYNRKGFDLRLWIDDFERDRNLMFSFHVRGSAAGTVYVTVDGAVTDVLNKNGGWLSGSVTTGWNRLTFNLGRITSLNASTPCVRMRFSAARTWYINTPMLEYGTVASDWSPARQDTEQKISDIDYLKQLFPNSTLVTGASISQMAVVTDGDPENGGKVVAGLNGTEIGSDVNHGKALIFAGSEGADDEGINASNTILYQDGHITAKSVDLQGRIVATSGMVGDFDVRKDGMWMEAESPDGKYRHQLSAAVHQLVNDGGMYNCNTTIRSQSYSGTEGNGSAIAITRKVIDKDQLTSGSNVGIEFNVEGAPEGWNGVSRDIDGNFAIRCVKGQYAGFRPATRFLGNSSTQISKMDHSVFVWSESGIPVITLPSDPENGQEYRIHKTKGFPLKINGNGNTLHDPKQSKATEYTYLSSFCNPLILTWVESDKSWWIGY